MFTTYIVSPLAGLDGGISWQPPAYRLFWLRLLSNRQWLIGQRTLSIQVWLIFITNKKCQMFLEVFFLTSGSWPNSMLWLVDADDFWLWLWGSTRRGFWHATQDCVVPYVNHILHRDQFWAISIASGSLRLWDLRSCCTVLSHVMQGVSLWSPPVLWRESWQDPLGICVFVHTCNVPKKGSGLLQWIFGCPVSLQTSSVWTNWCHLIPSKWTEWTLAITLWSWWQDYKSIIVLVIITIIIRSSVGRHHWSEA